MGYFGDRWKVLGEAVGGRRFLIVSIVILIISILGLLSANGVTWLKAVPTWAVVVVVPLLLVLKWVLDYAVTLVKDAEPVLDISYEERPPYVMTEPRDSASPSWRYVRIKVTNTGRKNLGNCFVRLEDVKAGDRSVNMFTPIGLTTQHQALQNRPGGPFALRGGEHKFVEVAALEERQHAGQIMLRYETKDYPNTIPRGDYTLIIRAYGGNAPCERTFRLFVEDGRLRFLPA
jgi:hypothetical protein